MTNFTPEEQHRLEELDAMIAANKLHISPVKAERQKILATARHRAFRERRKNSND